MARRGVKFLDPGLTPMIPSVRATEPGIPQRYQPGIRRRYFHYSSKTLPGFRGEYGCKAET